MIHAFVIANNTVRQSSKFVTSESFSASIQQDEFPFVGVGTLAHPGPMPWSGDASADVIGIVPHAENNNVQIVNMHGRFFATTDQDLYFEFDPKSLATLGGGKRFTFNDSLSPPEISGNTATQSAAHCATDAATGDLQLCTEPDSRHDGWQDVAQFLANEGWNVKRSHDPRAPSLYQDG